MGCELSKPAKNKAPKYKTYQAKNSPPILRRVVSSISDSVRVPSSVAGTVRSDRDTQELPIEQDQSTSSRTELLVEPLKEVVLVDDIDDMLVQTSIPADHILEEDIVPQSGPLEQVPKSMFDEEVLVALATFEREHMLRKDCEFEAILAQVNGA